MVSTAPSVPFSPIDLSDPDEMMQVTNTSTKDISWYGVRRLYHIPGKGTAMLPFHIIVRYLGDPRSDYRKTETFTTPSGDRGVIPERRGELIRLSVMYGLYHGKIAELPKKAPKVVVTRLSGEEIQFPIFDPSGKTYAYQTPQQGIVDARTEFERIQKKIMELEQRQNSLMEHAVNDDEESAEAPEDAHPGV